jgi:hypothetical protein
MSSVEERLGVESLSVPGHCITSSENSVCPISFKRSTLGNDLATLSMAYLLGHHPKLKELAQAIVTLHAKLIDSDQVSIQPYPKIGDPTTPHQSPLLAAQCAEFTIYLTLYMNQEPSSVAAAMEILLE